MKTKVCRDCNLKKPLSEFNKYAKIADGYNTRCKPCWKLHNKKYERKRLPLLEKKDQHYKNRYGISLEQYNEIKISQNFCCAICKLHEQLTVRKRLVVDHCHTTGKVRGLLCDNCNHGLGKFKDSISNLESAIEYLGVGETVIHSSEQDEDEIIEGELIDDDE